MKKNHLNLKMVSDSYYRSLIEAVRQLPVLYDRAHPDFRNVRKRNEAWKLVSETLFKRGFSPNEGTKIPYQLLAAVYQYLVRSIEKSILINTDKTKSLFFCQMLGYSIMFIKISSSFTIFL